MRTEIRMKDVVLPILGLKDQLGSVGNEVNYHLSSNDDTVILIVNGVEHRIPYEVCAEKSSFELKCMLHTFKIGIYHHPQIKEITDYVSKNWHKWCKGTPISWGINENLNSIEITYKNKVTTTVTRDFNSILFIINNKKQ